jgi:dihydrolipoamide dehydrogenase
LASLRTKARSKWTVSSATNIPGYFAIGDCTPGQALAHVASAEGIICVEKIAGQNPEPLDYNNIPGCTYCSPEIASVGYDREAGEGKRLRA